MGIPKTRNHLASTDKECHWLRCAFEEFQESPGVSSAMFSKVQSVGSHKIHSSETGKWQEFSAIHPKFTLTEKVFIINGYPHQFWSLSNDISDFDKQFNDK